MRLNSKSNNQKLLIINFFTYEKTFYFRNFPVLLSGNRE